MQSDSVDDDDDDDEEVDDLIELRGCDRITQWKFPENLTNCPVRRCVNQFHSRSRAIKHYKQQHADRSIFCPLCEKPICLNTQKYFIEHFRKAHPHKKIPYNFEDENSETSLTEEVRNRKHRH